MTDALLCWADENRHTYRNPSSRIDYRLHSLASSIAARMAPQYVSVSKGEGGVAVLTLTRCVLAR
jgi:hypothetical protein